MMDKVPPLGRQPLRQYNDRRKQLNEEMPALAARIFALRKIFYTGAGFHWSLECRFGRLLAMINNYDTPSLVTDPIMLDVVYEEIIDTVERAERSAQGAQEKSHAKVPG